MTNRALLLVEDNEDDVFLMKRAIKEAGISNPLLTVENGQEAIDYLTGTGDYENRAEYPLPAVVFLDLKLPLKSGHEVLAWIRQHREFDSLVVVVLTASGELSDIRKSYQLGANSYLVKPPTSRELLDVAKSFKWYWLEYNKFDTAKTRGDDPR